MPRIIHNVLRTCMYVCIYVYILYIYIYILHVAYCFLHVAYCTAKLKAAEKAARKAAKAALKEADCSGGQQLGLCQLRSSAFSKACVKRIRLMRHGHEMLWFSRGSFSESELPLSYNAFLENTRMRAFN